MQIKGSTLLGVALGATLCWGGSVAHAQHHEIAAEGQGSGHYFSGAEPTADELALSASLAWDSRYVSEGRDNLDGDSLVGTTVGAAYKGFNLGAWFAASPVTNAYTEFNITLAYTIEYEGWEATAGYTHLAFLTDDANDDEVGVGLGYTAIPGGLTAHADWYYSFDAEGSFIELGIGGEYDVCDSLKLSPGAAMGINAGYVADGHDGLNNVAVSLEGAVPIKEGVDLMGYVAYNWSIDADPQKYGDDESLDDFAFGGVSLSMVY